MNIILFFILLWFYVIIHTDLIFKIIIINN